MKKIKLLLSVSFVLFFIVFSYNVSSVFGEEIAVKDPEGLDFFVIPEFINLPTNTVTLHWNIDTAKNPSSCVASGSNPDGGWVGPKNFFQVNSQVITFSSAGSYFFGITCTLDGVSTYRPVLVNVYDPFPEVTFTSSVIQEDIGKFMVVLKWVTSNITSCTLYKNATSILSIPTFDFGLSDSKTEPISESTNYKINCIGPSGEESKTISVSPCPDCTVGPITLSANGGAQCVAYGERAKFTWSSDANKCFGDGFNTTGLTDAPLGQQNNPSSYSGSKALSDSMMTASKEFILTCKKTTEKGSRSVEPPITVLVGAEPTVVEKVSTTNDSISIKWKKSANSSGYKFYADNFLVSSSEYDCSGTTSCTYTHSGLKDNTPHTYSVQPISSESICSNPDKTEETFKTDAVVVSRILTVTKSGDGGGNVTVFKNNVELSSIPCVSGECFTLSKDDIVTITATPSLGSDFFKWTGYNGVSLKMDAHKIVDAKFLEKRNYTLNASGDLILKFKGFPVSSPAITVSATPSGIPSSGVKVYACIVNDSNNCADNKINGVQVDFEWLDGPNWKTNNPILKYDTNTVQLRAKSPVINADKDSKKVKIYTVDVAEQSLPEKSTFINLKYENVNFVPTEF